jgi:hypothetical protein
MRAAPRRLKVPATYTPPYQINLKLNGLVRFGPSLPFSAARQGKRHGSTPRYCAARASVLFPVLLPDPAGSSPAGVPGRRGGGAGEGGGAAGGGPGAGALRQLLPRGRRRPAGARGGSIHGSSGGGGGAAAARAGPGRLVAAVELLQLGPPATNRAGRPPPLIPNTGGRGFRWLK